MPIVNSIIVSAVVQVDGRRSVLERHTDQNANTYDVSYLADVGLDINAVMTTRAGLIGTKIDATSAQLVAAQSYEIPMTTIQFLDRLTLAERIAIRNAGSTDAVIADYLDYLNKVYSVYRNAPLGQKTIDGLNYLVSKGLLVSTRPAQILAP